MTTEMTILMLHKNVSRETSLLFTQCATSNASRHFKSPLAMGRDAFKSKHASSVSISGVIDTGVNSNFFTAFYHMMRVSKVNFATH